MFDLNTLADFSRANCISICAFLVPVNLIATLLAIIPIVLRRPPVKVWKAAGIGSIFAVLMLYHVFTWFMIGIVMAPTYILLCLGSICLFTNIVAITYNYKFTLARKSLITINYF